MITIILAGGINTVLSVFHRDQQSRGRSDSGEPKTRFCLETSLRLQLNTLQTNTDDGTERWDPHKQAEADTSSSSRLQCRCWFMFVQISLCGGTSQSLVCRPFVFFQVQNLTLAFQAAESVGIKPSLVSRCVAEPSRILWPSTGAKSEHGGSMMCKVDSLLTVMWLHANFTETKEIYPPFVRMSLSSKTCK